MVKYLFWIGLGLFAVWLVKATGIIVAATLFLLAGVVPGTQWSVPPIAMFVLLGLLLIFVLYWIKRQQLRKQIRALKTKHNPAEAQKKTHKTTRPRARYSQPKAAIR